MRKNLLWRLIKKPAGENTQAGAREGKHQQTKKAIKMTKDKKPNLTPQDAKILEDEVKKFIGKSGEFEKLIMKPIKIERLVENSLFGVNVILESKDKKITISMKAEKFLNDFKLVKK